MRSHLSPTNTDLGESHDAMEWAQFLNLLAKVGSCAVPAHVHNPLPLLILKASSGSHVGAKCSEPVLRLQVAYIRLSIDCQRQRVSPALSSAT